MTTKAANYVDFARVSLVCLFSGIHIKMTQNSV